MMHRVFKTREPRDWWNTVALGLLVGIAFLVIWFNACSPVSPGAKTNQSTAPASTQAATPASESAPVTTGVSVPTSLANAGEYGENVYDYAKANDWKNADVKLAALRDAVNEARTEIKNQSAGVEGLDSNVTALGRAVTAKDRETAMREANQVTLKAADMSAAYKLTVPVEVIKLDYYGRELEIGAAAKDTNRLQATAREIRLTWDSVRPSIEARSATEAKTFGALVAQVEAAKAPADYARLATLVLNEVDNLEKLFP